MGVDMNFFVKIKKDNKYIDLPLYNKEGEPVSITYCGWALFNRVKEVFRTLSFEEMKEHADHYYKGWEDDDYAGITTYETSLTYLMYLVEKTDPIKLVFSSDKKDDDDEDKINMNKFYTEIVNSVNVMLDLADEDYIHPDNVKIVMLASY